jgi:hypothetical protein
VSTTSTTGKYRWKIANVELVRVPVQILYFVIIYCWKLNTKLVLPTFCRSVTAKFLALLIHKNERFVIASKRKYVLVNYILHFGLMKYCEVKEYFLTHALDYMTTCLYKLVLLSHSFTSFEWQLFCHIVGCRYDVA